MTITENDFIEKMIDIAKTGYESMIQLQCVFFTWNEFFNTKEDACRAFEVASQIFSINICYSITIQPNRKEALQNLFNACNAPLIFYHLKYLKT